MQSLTSLLATAILLISFSGCSYLFWPRADEYLQKAKGANGVETILNLTTMLEASAKAARGGKGYDQSLNDLHNQFHALESQAADNVDGFFRMRTGSKATEIPAYRTDFGPPRDPLS